MSILEEVRRERIVSFKLSESLDLVELKERCDSFFIIGLDKKEFGQMIEELRELHSKMVD